MRRRSCRGFLETRRPLWLYDGQQDTSSQLAAGVRGGKEHDDRRRGKVWEALEASRARAAGDQNSSTRHAPALRLFGLQRTYSCRLLPAMRFTLPTH